MSRVFFDRLTPPPALRPGDRVAVCAPSGPVRPERLRAGLTLLERRYRPSVDQKLFFDDSYLAGSDAARAAAVNRALGDPDVRAVFCARGGYGLTRILDQLDGDALRADPKPIVGFSDITALLAWALQQGVVPVHAPVITQLPDVAARGDVEALFALLESPGHRVVLAAAPGSPPDDAPAGGPVGPVVGGNLAVLAALAGTPWAPPLAGAIVALEEIGEAPYRIDRLLTQLLAQPGDRALSTARGLAVGGLTQCHALAGPTALAVIAERASVAGLPFVTGLPFGHGRRNRAFPLGVPAALDPDRGALVFTGGAVA